MTDQIDKSQRAAEIFDTIKIYAALYGDASVFDNPKFESFCKKYIDTELMLEYSDTMKVAKGKMSKCKV